MSPHDPPELEPEPEPEPMLAAFATELAEALQGIEDAHEKLEGHGHIGAVLLLHLAARQWIESNGERETFISLAQTLVGLETETRRT